MENFLLVVSSIVLGIILNSIFKYVIKLSKDKLITTLKTVGITLLVGALVSVVVKLSIGNEPGNVVGNEEHVSKSLSSSEMVNDSILYDFIVSLNIEHPEIVVAQAKVESASYTSNVFKKTGNLFGMGLAKNRPTVASGNYNQYSDYKIVNLPKWQLSVIDYAIYQASHFKNLSEEEYLNKLQRIYAEDPNYKSALLMKVKSLKVKSAKL